MEITLKGDIGGVMAKSLEAGGGRDGMMGKRKLSKYVGIREVITCRLRVIVRT